MEMGRIPTGGVDPYAQIFIGKETNRTVFGHVPEHVAVPMMLVLVYVIGCGTM